MNLPGLNASAPLRVAHLGNCPLPDARGRARPALQRRHPGRWVLDHVVAQLAVPFLEARLFTVARGLSTDIATRIDGVDTLFIASNYRACVLRAFMPDRRKLCAAVSGCGADIVHAHGTEFAYALAAHDSRLPAVITAQGLMFMIVPRIRPPLCSWLRLIRIHEHRALTKARHVIAKSDIVAKALRQRYPHLELHRIPNTFNPRLLDIRQAREDNTIVFVGTIDHRKGVHILRNALQVVCREIPAARLWIAGDLGDAGGAYEKRELAALRQLMGNRLTTFGRLSQIEVAKLMARASVLAAPSIEDMFGNQLIEALLVGTPAVVADDTGLAENARRYGNATVVPQNDPDSLAQAIIGALRRRNVQERETARARIVGDMHPEKVALAHAEVYRHIVGEWGRCD